MPSRFWNNNRWQSSRFGLNVEKRFGPDVILMVKNENNTFFLENENEMLKNENEHFLEKPKS